MNTFVEKTLNIILGIGLFLALLPFKLVQYAFFSAGEMGGYMIADHHIEQEKERGVYFTNSDEDYTRYGKF